LKSSAFSLDVFVDKLLNSYARGLIRMEKILSFLTKLIISLILFVVLILGLRFSRS